MLVSYKCNGGGDSGGGYSERWATSPVVVVSGTNRTQRPMDQGQTPWGGGAAFSLFSQVSKTILVFETGIKGNSEADSFQPDANSLSMTNHLATTNFLFADGHVKAMKPMATIGTTLNMWSMDPDTVPPSGSGRISNVLASVSEPLMQ